MDNPLAVEYLEQFVKKIEKLEEDKTQIMEDLRQVYDEAKFKGFDVKILKKLIRIKQQDQAKLTEEEEMLRLYREALGV